MLSPIVKEYKLRNELTYQIKVQGNYGIKDILFQ